LKKTKERKCFTRFIPSVKSVAIMIAAPPVILISSIFFISLKAAEAVMKKKEKDFD
jgi:hypothetical protein